MRTPRMAAAVGAALTLLALPAAADAAADLAVTASLSPDPIVAGEPVTYTIDPRNDGPDPASATTLSLTVTVATYVDLVAPPGWTCATPAVGAPTGTIVCSTASYPVPGSAPFTLTVAVPADTPAGTPMSLNASIDSPDPGTSGLATLLRSVTTSADLVTTIAGSPDPATVGDDVTYTVGVDEDGPSDAQAPSVDLALPAGATFQSLAAPPGWTCTTPAVGATGGTAGCTRAALTPGSSAFSVVLRPTAAASGGTIAVTATASSATADPTPADATATAVTAVGAPPPPPPSTGLRRPTVTAVTPGTGLPGSFVAIAGDGFAGTTEVRFGDVPTLFVVDGHERISAVVPPGIAGSTVEIVVRNPVGSNPRAAGARFGYAPPAPPATGDEGGGHSPARVVCASVPDLVGQKMRRARRTLRRAGCAEAPLRRTRGSRRGGRAEVRRQRPEPGTTLRAGETIVVRAR